MAWTTTLLARLRLYIGDSVAPQTYTDSVLNNYIVLAAIDVDSETNLTTAFTFDTDVPSITPDPVTDTTVSVGISNLFVAKAAVIISLSEVRRDVAKYGIKIKDDLTEYDGRGAMKGRTDAYNFFLNNFHKIKYEWEIGNKTAGKAIFGPYASADGFINNDGSSFVSRRFNF